MCSTRRKFTLAAFVASLAISQAVAAPPSGPPAASLDIFSKADGESYFAISLRPQTPVPTPAAIQAAPHNIVVMFDTSASQTGDFRTKALAALDVFAANLGPNDRLQLVAVDLNAVPLTQNFVAPGSAEFKQAIDKLHARVPLGSTDMGNALRGAMDRFAAAPNAGAQRAIAYIGDGMSAANLIATGEMQELVSDLVKGRISMSSYAIGPQLDIPLLGALANHTGGLVGVERVVDEKDGQVRDEYTAKQVGESLSWSVRQPVLWPTNVKLPAELGEVYPKQIPPLRFDRATVLLGRGKTAGAVEVAMSAEQDGKAVQLNWTLPASQPQADNAYLADIVSSAQRDDGISLPTVGTEGLREIRLLYNVQVNNLFRLTQQALSMGNLKDAEQMAGEVLRRDPENPEAKQIRQAIATAKQKVVKDRMSGARPAGGNALKLMSFRQVEGGEALPVPPPAANPAASDGAFLTDVARRSDIIRQQTIAAVDNTISQARSIMGLDPGQADSLLKLQLENVRKIPELTADVRMQQLTRLEQALRQTAAEATRRTAIDLQEQERLAKVEAEQAMLRGLYDKQAKIQQISQRMQALMDEARYRDAEEAARANRELEPQNPALYNAVFAVRTIGNQTDAMAIRDARHQGFVDSLRPAEVSHIPTPDDPPIRYPAPEVWRLLTEKRAKYRSVDLTQVGPTEAKIIKSLDDVTELEFVETPLTDVIDFLKARHGIEIQPDTKALTDANVALDTPITKNLKGITLRSALRILLRDLDLKYVIQDEVLMITTKDVADDLTKPKVYPVADLVIPIRNGGMSGFGGLGGGMGGGMGGGGMGGMGGMGGGMGGMGGGGMGGMGGGGGMFAVKDNLKLSSKNSAPAAAAPVAAEKPAPVAPAAAPGKIVPIQPLQVEIGPGVSPEKVWNDLFAKEVQPAASVRETVRLLSAAGKYEHVIALVNAALRSGQGQPWMFEALGLSMQANGSLPSDVERALMSLIDFKPTVTDLAYLAEYMARSGFEKRALQLYRQISRLDPNRPDAYAYGLTLAVQQDDFNAIRWATLGILSQAWPKDQLAIWGRAERVAKATLADLKSKKRFDEAKSYEAELRKALERDCVIIVRWTGDADVDLMIEEPSGTVCSFRNPRTTAGGVLLGDSNSRANDATSPGKTEIYVCPKAFAGNYRMIIKKVWGKLTADQVTVDIYAHYMADNEKRITKQVALVNDEAVADFDMQNGRRTEPLEEQQVAQAVKGQLAIGKQILAQQLNVVGAQDITGFTRNRQNLLNGFNAVALPFQGAVGYQPIIITLPEGANMSAVAVVSSDRRYVRITPQPLFSGITKVNTFNYATGSSGTSNGGSGGAGFSGGGGGGI